MKKLFKKCLLALILAAIIISLCGCDLFTVDTDELLSPPAPEGDMYPISMALKAAAPEGYSLKYPSIGEHRSAFVVEDIDGDGILEAFAFYLVSEGETSNIHVNFIKKKKDKWKSVADSSLEGSGVEKVDFCDLDGDGVKEILIGWQIYGTSEKRLGVYSAQGDTLSERLLQQYTTFTCSDIDLDGTEELFLQLLNVSEKTNHASIYTIKDGGVTNVAGCTLDGSVKTSSEPKCATLISGKSAIFLDETKGLGSITEVLLFEGGELINPLLDAVTLENVLTFRSTNLSSKDIDGDGVPEIPNAAAMPTVDGGEEKAYYTNWCAFDGEKFSVIRVEYTVTADNYSIEIPQRLVGALALKKDTEGRKREFYLYDSQQNTVGNLIFSVTAVPTAKYEKSKNGKDVFEIEKGESLVYLGCAAEGTENGVTRKELKEMFKQN